MANQGDRFTIQSVVPGVEPIEVVFRFIQKGFEHIPDQAMYDLTTDISGHPAESTVSRSTLENLGYVLPNEAP